MTATTGASRAMPAWGGYVVANLVASLMTPLRRPRSARAARLVPAWRRYAPYLPPLAAFIPAYECALVITDLITALLLLSHQLEIAAAEFRRGVISGEDK